MKRKEFMKIAAAAGTGTSFMSFSQVLRAERKTTPHKLLPRRPLGSTGEYLSIIGLGGVVVMQIDQGEANKIVQDSIEAGVNYFDVAPTYGNAQERLGPALEPFRKDVFLACKSEKRTAKEMTDELHESFRLLKTDYFDLYQLHSFDTPDDIKTVFGKGGAIEAIEQFKKDGKIRFAGFSTHCTEAAMQAMDLYDFDTVLTPLNFVVWYNGNHGPDLVEYARNKGMGVLAIKSLAFTKWPDDIDPKDRPYNKCWYQPIYKEDISALALRFTLSIPVTAAIPPGNVELYYRALKLAPSFIPVSEKEKDELKHIAKDVTPIFRYPSDGFTIIEKEG